MIDGLKHASLIAAKDLKLFATDRLALGLFILFPFIFVLIFNFMLAGVGSEDKRLVLHLVTLEGEGSISQQVISGMETKEPEKLGPGQPQIIWDKDYAVALQSVKDKRLAGFLLFPEDFTNGVMMGSGTKLEVVVDPSDTTVRAALNGLASSVAARVSSQQIADSAAINLIVQQGIKTGNVANLGQDIQQIFVGQQQPPTSAPAITVATDQVGGIKAFNPANYVIPGYLVMFTFFAAAQSASVVVRERQNNTLERLLATSASRQAIIGGMFAGTVAKGLVQVVIFWTVGALAFKIDMGLSPAAVLLLSLLMVLVSASFSIMLATLARTERAAGALGVLVSLVLAPIGGCWWPLFITPSWMQSIAKLTPHGWANSGFNALMVFGGNFSGAVPSMVALAAFAVVFLAIAVARFRTSSV
jgi:ABC-2 type transport system permease protein